MLEGVVKKKIKETFTKKDGTEGSKIILVVEEQKDTYPQSCAFNCRGKGEAAADAVNEWDRVSVEYNLRTREYNGKYYTSVDARSIVKVKWTVESTNNDELPF